MPPLPLPEHSLALEGEEYDEGLPPPPWPSSDYPQMSVAAEERQVVVAIDRMMSELQLMRDSVTSSVTANTRPHSTPQSQNLPQSRRVPEQHDTLTYTWKPEHYSPISHSQPNMYQMDAGYSTRHPVRPDTRQSHPARGRQFSPVSATLEGEYKGPAPKIPLFV